MKKLTLEAKIARHFFTSPKKLVRKPLERLRFVRNTMIGWRGDGVRLFKATATGLEPADSIEEADVVASFRFCSPVVVIVVERP